MPKTRLKAVHKGSGGPSHPAARALRLDQPENGVAVALARPAHRAEPVDPDLLQPGRALTPLVVVRLDGHRAERERPGNRLERLDADRNADHPSPRFRLPDRIPLTFSSLASSSASALPRSRKSAQLCIVGLRRSNMFDLWYASTTELLVCAKQLSATSNAMPWSAAQERKAERIPWGVYSPAPSPFIRIFNAMTERGLRGKAPGKT